MTKQRRTATTELKREVASLVLEGYSHIEADQSIGLVESASRRWGS